MLIAVAAVVVIGLVEWVIARIWWILGGTVLLVALAVAACSEPAAHQPDPAQAASAAIENHLYYRYHVAASPEADRVIRTMLPGQAGDAAAGE